MENSGGPIQEASPLLTEETTFEEIIEKEPPPKIPVWKLVALTISFLGVQFGWAVQIA